MEYFCIILVGCAIIWFVYYMSNKNAPLLPPPQKKCINCKKQVDKYATVCPYCAKDPDILEPPLPPPMKPCINCGRQIGKDLTYCPYCGKDQEPPPPPPPMKSCVNCNKQIGKYLTVCPHCGKNPDKVEEHKTLDEIYAEKNGMWVCEYCETFNPNKEHICVACGVGTK